MKVFHNIEKNEWDQVIENCSYATFFHSYSWYKIFTKTYDYLENKTIKITFNNGKYIILPLLKDNKKNIFISSPTGTYGGWIAPGNLDSKQKTQILSWMQENIKYFVFRANPYDVNSARLFKKLTPSSEKIDFTQKLNLERGYNEIFKNYSKGHKYNIKKSKEFNLEIAQAKSFSDYNEYFAVYQDSINRWGKSSSNNYPLSLFENIYNQKNENIKLWLTKYQGKIICGALVFYCNKHAVWWHGASLKKYLNTYAANFLQDAIIKDACDKGFATYDLNPSGKHLGVEKFKASFGAKKTESPVYHNIKPELGLSIINKIKNVKETIKKHF